MPYLGDYLGQLLSEITLARMQADLETIRLAELYASHPLLRTMPVPHVRLPEVELDIPVLIKESEEPRADSSTRGGATLADMRRKLDELLPEHLSRAGIELSDNERARLRAALDQRLKSADMPKEISGDVRRVSDDLAATVIRVIEELRPKPEASEASEPSEPAVSAPIAEGLREAVRLEFLKLRTPPPRLFVLVTSSEIREAGNSENVMRLRLKVTEEGVEWTTIELDGVQHDRLVPE